jgi:Ras-related GTP-binding protein A/B
MKYYRSCIEALQEYSPTAKIFVMIHKMDKKPADQRASIFAGKRSEVKENSGPMKAKCFPTSIWDETLYHAWSTIIVQLIQNYGILQSALESFCIACDADEVVLFERSTFLVVSNYSRKSFPDEHRFERISNIIK